MKNITTRFQNNFYIPLFLFFIIFSTPIFATQLANDHFTNGDLNGWGGDGYTYNNDGWMYIKREDIAKKTYHFGSNYANATLTITFKFWVSSDWDYNDNFKIYKNHTRIQKYKNLGSDTEYTKTITTNADANGNFILKFKPDSNHNNEYAAIDYVIIYGTTTTNNCNGCDCSLDTSSNDSSPGNLITTLDQVDSNITTCISGASENDDKDYYHFTTAVNGILHIQTSSPNNHPYHMEIESNKQGTLLNYDTDENRDLTYTLQANEKIIFLFKETGNDKDEYQANLSFTTSDYIENADDICFDDISYTTRGFGICIDFGIVKGGMNCEQQIPLKNQDPNKDLSNVNVILDTSSFNSNFFGDCGIYAGEGDESCSESSAINFGPFNIFSTAISYDLGKLEVDTNDTIWEYAAMSMALFNKENLYATYTKDGKKYRGKVKQCIDGYCANLNRGDRDFIIRNPENTRNIYGNYAVIGNQNLCTDKNDNGTCEDDPKTTSNSYRSIYVDTDNDITTVNSSKSTLDIPDNAKVLWAGLYWQGTIHNSDNDNDSSDEDFGKNGLWVTGNKVLNATNYDNNHKQIDLMAPNNGYGAYNACKLKFKVPNGNYVELSADQLDYSKLGYGGFVDVTSLIDKNNPNGVYAIADIKAQTGKETTHGNYAAWSLVVIYENPNEKFRNISLFDGFVTVTSSYNGELTMDGFLTQKTPPIESKLAFFTLDGDGGSNSISIDDQQISNTNHPATHFFNSTINNSIQRDPSFVSARVDLDYIELENILSPSQTSAVIKPRSGGDRYTASYFIMSAELRTINLCYDYTYGQNGFFQTAPSLQPAKIEGTFNNDPINVKLYFKNKENSDVTISNLKVNIDPIDANTSYKNNSTFVTKPGNSSQEFVSDSGRDTGVNKDNNISIGDVGSLEYFYTYYSLEHTQNDINATINVSLSYDLQIAINGQTINLDNQTLSINNMSVCQNSFNYEPVPGRFNIVHNGQSKTSDPFYYFNLPTQVVNRSGNYKLASMDPNDLNHSKILPKSTIVAIEMLDLTGFHYTTATCTDHNASVASNKRVWITMNANTKLSDVDKIAIKNANFFNRAIKNAAFRISYNSDTNGTLLTLDDLGNGQYKLQNFTAVAGDKCADNFTPTIGNSNQVVTYCGNNGQGQGNNGMNQNELEECMECIYGLNTKIMCSRDNFAIRPEAFSFKFIDHNQSNPLQTSFIIDNNGTAIKKANLAAGYNYLFTINATDHFNNTSVLGYTTNDLDANMTWQEATPLDCNDESNITLQHSFINGIADSNKTWNNIGKYKLHIQDTKWTEVDTLYLNHHISPYFKTGIDCDENSSVVQLESASSYNGCTISSDHNNTEYFQSFQDMLIVYHPYKFDLSSISPSIGLAFTPISITTPYIYISDISNSQDENMSYHLNGTIRAMGENNVTLSNFVNKCYAKPLNINISTSNRDLNDSSGNHVDYKIRFHDINVSKIITALDINITDNNITSHTNDIVIQTLQTPTKGYFPKNLNGTMQTRINMNYTRQKNMTINPTTIMFKTYKVNCTNENNCTFSADMENNKTTKGIKDLNNTIAHYYGRTHVPRQRCIENNITAPLYYEVFCFGNDCNKTLLQDSLNSDISDDPRWFINTKHTKSKYGSPGRVNQRTYSVGNGYVTEITPPSGNAPDHVTLHYNGTRGYPYKTTMENNASSWLIYNQFNSNATKNEFEVEFNNADTAWAGARKTNDNTKRNAADKTNRRTMW